jgi:hypothetical protein
MLTDTAIHNFTFRSSLLGTNFTRCFGLAVIWVSFDFLRNWLSPSWSMLPYMLILAPVGLLLFLVGAGLLIFTCDIEIVAGRLRVRRLFAWKSVPLESLTRARVLLGVVYLRIDQPGECTRVVFSPEDYKLRPHPLPIVRFLREVCEKNPENRKEP